VKRSSRAAIRADVLLFLAVAAVALSVGLAAIVPRPADFGERARAIQTQLRCPTCQGLSIADSPATSATQMREIVREQLASGATDDEVRAFFVARYGRWILLDPPAAGVDLALWLFPALVVSIGALLVVRRARAHAPVGAEAGGWGRPSIAGGRLPSLLIGSAMALALALPIAAGVGPRLAGQEVTGAVPRAGPSIDDREAVVRARPKDLGALVALGDALLTDNRPGEAAEQYKAALEVDPNHVPALLGIGTILLAADRPDAAGPVFDRVLAASPDQPDALLYRAVARLRLAGTVTDQVRADVARFLEVAPAGDTRRAMANGLVDGSGAFAPASTAPPQSSPRP
jgi:cytochrome c-type biogenesis protein CcmH